LGSFPGDSALEQRWKEGRSRFCTPWLVDWAARQTRDSIHATQRVAFERLPVKFWIRLNMMDEMVGLALENANQQKAGGAPALKPYVIDLCKKVAEDSNAIHDDAMKFLDDMSIHDEIDWAKARLLDQYFFTLEHRANFLLTHSRPCIVRAKKGEKREYSEEPQEAEAKKEKAEGTKGKVEGEEKGNAEVKEEAAPEKGKAKVEEKGTAGGTEEATPEKGKAEGNEKAAPETKPKKGTPTLEPQQHYHNLPPQKPTPPKVVIASFVEEEFPQRRRVSKLDAGLQMSFEEWPTCRPKRHLRSSFFTLGAAAPTVEGISWLHDAANQMYDHHSPWMPQIEDVICQHLL